MQNIDSISSFSELIRKFESCQPQHLTPRTLEKIILARVSFEQFSTVVKQIQRAVNPGPLEMHHTIYLILHRHSQLNSIIFELEAITKNYQSITLTRGLINKLIITSNASTARQEILAHLAVGFKQAWPIDTKLFEHLLKNSTDTNLLLSIIKLIPSAFVTPESFNTILGMNDEYLLSLHYVLCDLHRTNTTEILNNEEVFNYILYSRLHLLTFHSFIQIKASAPIYSFLTANHILQVLQNETLSQAIPWLMFTTTAAPHGPWITESIFNRWCHNYLPILSIASQLSYYFCHHNKDLLSPYNINKLLIALLNQGDDLSSLFFLIYEKNLSHNLTQQTFDILTEPQSHMIQLLYTLALEDITDTILSECLISTFHLYAGYLPTLEPLLLALSSAKAGLITETTLPALVAHGDRVQESVMRAITEHSPETWLPAIDERGLPPRQACSLKSLLRLYRSVDVASRGNIPFLIASVKKMVQKFILNPRHLLWAENLAKYFLEGCVNQPVRGFSEISAWLFVAEQQTLVKKFEALQYPMILDLIHKKLAVENTMTQVEVEKANALFRELCLHHPYTAEWDGIPEGLAYEHTITTWLTQQSFLQDLWAKLTFSSATNLKDFLYEQDFMNTWAPIAFEQQLLESEAQETVIQQQFHELVEAACENIETFFITPEHFPLLWPGRPPLECAVTLARLLQQGLSYPDIINRSFQSVSNSKEARIYNFVTEQTNLVALEFDHQKGQAMEQRTALLLSICRNPITQPASRPVRPQIFSQAVSPDPLTSPQSVPHS